MRSCRPGLLVSVLCLAAACSTGGDEGSAVTTSTSSEASTPITTGPPRYDGDPDSPFCTLLRDVDTSDILSGDPGDPTAVEVALGRLVGVLGEAAAVAPPEVVDDVTLVADGVGALDEALAGFGYDFDALAASEAAAQVTEAVNDPVFTDAGIRLSGYRTEVCGL